MFDYTIVLTIAYIVIVGLLYAPRCPKAESQDFRVDYFPEVEEELELETAIAEVVGETVSPTKTTQDIADELPDGTGEMISPLKTTSEPAQKDLSTLSIRSLKKLAASAKIRRYSSLTKAQLIHALGGLELPTIA